MTIADRCEEHRCPVYNASPRRAAKRLFGGFLFPGIFPTAGKRGRIGAKLIYDQQEGKIKMETGYIAGGYIPDAVLNKYRDL